jgi:hypothetical protein
MAVGLSGAASKRRSGFSDHDQPAAGLPRSDQFSYHADATHPAFRSGSRRRCQSGRADPSIAWCASATPQSVPDTGTEYYVNLAFLSNLSPYPAVAAAICCS